MDELGLILEWTKSGLSSGADMATCVLAYVLWKMDRRILKLEIKTSMLDEAGE